MTARRVLTTTERVYLANYRFGYLTGAARALQNLAPDRVRQDMTPEQLVDYTTHAAGSMFARDHDLTSSGEVDELLENLRAYLLRTMAPEDGGSL